MVKPLPDDIRSLLDQGFSQQRIADKLGLTKGQVSGLVTRSKGKPQSVERRILPPRELSWEDRLTESWADRKARLARERARANVHA